MTEFTKLVKTTDSDMYFVKGLWRELILKRGLNTDICGTWNTVEPSLDLEPLYASVSNHGTHFLFDQGSTLVYAYLTPTSIHFDIAGSDEDSCNKTLDNFKELFPETVATDDTVPINFWTWTANGPRKHNRSIEVPHFIDIAENYTQPVKEQLDKMMYDFRPAFGGQLVLWMGEPGTGKTWALRALAYEWKDWADFHYIVDPEHFFGTNSEYLLDVLLDTDIKDKWKILILEDTGELLAADAKERVGQSLSRLLNVVDGIIGQGLKVLCLVTTNDEIKSLHHAVSRPGRCAAKIEFLPLDEMETTYWLQARGLDSEDDSGSKRLADLFAIVDGYTDKPKAKAAIGFSG